MVSLVSLLFLAWLLPPRSEKELLFNRVRFPSSLKQALLSCKSCLGILGIFAGLADGTPRILTQVPASEFPVGCK